jgi:hypothetical protein
MRDAPHLLSALEQGDPKAAEPRRPLIYEELRRLAAHKLAQQPPGQTLQATALVPEAWLKLTAHTQTSWHDRHHFFGAAAAAMRPVLVDRARVESWIEAHEAAGGFLKSREGGADGLPATIVLPVPEKAGDQIGRYKLLPQIGEGGCGVVDMAEQEKPVRRRVALKVIKLGRDTRSVIARFEAERQALALMDHPNIARDASPYPRGSSKATTIRKSRTFHPRRAARRAGGRWLNSPRWRVPRWSGH